MSAVQTYLSRHLCMVAGQEAESLRRAMSGLPSCMGGWCSKRDACALHVQQPRGRYVERACHPGIDDPVPLMVVTPHMEAA